MDSRTRRNGPKHELIQRMFCMGGGNESRGGGMWPAAARAR